MAPTAAAVALTSDSSWEVEGDPIEPAKQSLQHQHSLFSGLTRQNPAHTRHQTNSTGSMRSMS